MSYKRLLDLETQLRQEVEELLALGEQADQVELAGGLVIEDEIAFRKNRLANLAEAKAVLEARAQERYEAELAEYETKARAREEKARQTGRKPRGRAPQPPTPGPRDKDQYNHYNTQVAVDQDSFLIVANTLSNHPNDYAEMEPTLDAIPAQLGTPDAAAMDNGYFSAGNVTACETRGIDPYIATGREPHHRRKPILPACPYPHWKMPARR